MEQQQSSSSTTTTTRKTIAILKVLFVINAIWDLIFIVASFYLFSGHTVYIAITLFVTVMMTQELFLYVHDSCKDELKIKWYLRHYNTLTILCIVKFCLLIWFAFIYLVDAADIHILHVLMYLTDEAASFLVILIFIFLTILILSVYIAPKYQRVIQDVADDTDRLQGHYGIN